MMNEWQEYTGSDEQIAEIWNNYNGFLLNTTDKILTKDNFKDSVSFVEYLKQGVTSYWLIPYDPLREMKIRQAMTGQPVWVKTTCIGYKPCEFGGDEMYSKQYIYSTTTPDWNIPGAEYSFTEFKGEV